ncbi:hypothetical protein GCM10007298_34240 [Williamsia phyllosphaerae]|uniref:Lipoprotein n=1 Tax=Williamsia phyllosphaerae TaxID=885042 RepID=A0ABQ1V2I5_9NOCA|nr:hypothetical protein GCM10007298_34240 [Williamsia phyllosphaerae]
MSVPPGEVESSPETQDGLPGCDWSLGAGDSHLELSVTKPVDAEALRQAATETFPVGPSAKGYVTVPGLLDSCQASVSSDKTPAGYLLQYRLRTYDDRFAGCQPATQQVAKVLEGLKW